jgi:hypothetical protein
VQEYHVHWDICFELTNIKLMRFYSIIVYAFCMVVEYSSTLGDKNIHFKSACLKIKCNGRNKRGEFA